MPVRPAATVKVPAGLEPANPESAFLVTAEVTLMTSVPEQADALTYLPKFWPCTGGPAATVTGNMSAAASTADIPSTVRLFTWHLSLRKTTGARCGPGGRNGPHIIASLLARPW